MKQIPPQIGTIALILLITGTIDSVRNLPLTALFGETLIFFFVISAIIFLIPVALVSAELAATWSDNSEGIFGWIRTAFGENIGFFAIWLQWINTLVWYPTILSYIAGTAAFLINPALAENKIYLAAIILIIFWGLTYINLCGIRISTKFASFCAIFGLIVPMSIIILLAMIWLITGNPIQLKFSIDTLLPHWGRIYDWVALIGIVTSFLGIELATVHINNVRQPEKKFPLAIFISVILILVTMVLGSLAIAIVLPKADIRLVAGIMQAFTQFFNAYHMGWFIPFIVLMLVIGSMGSMINWIISPTKGLLASAKYGFLPRFLCSENANQVPKALLILQAIIISLFIIALLLMPTINSFYWLFTMLSTELYMFMYVLMFLAAIKLRYQFPKKNRPFRIPGNTNLTMWFVALLGILGCSITWVVGFLPPEGINVKLSLPYWCVFGLGLITMISPVSIFYFYRGYRRNFCGQLEENLL